MYNKECQVYMKNNPGITINKYQVAELTARQYIKAMKSENCSSAFKKTGIHPYNNTVMTYSQLAPAGIYPEEEDPADPYPEESCDEDVPDRQEDKPDDQNEDNGTRHETLSLSETPEPIIPPPTPAAFFKERTITKVVTNRRKRKFVPPTLTGNLLKKLITDVLVKSAEKKNERRKKLSSPQI